MPRPTRDQLLADLQGLSPEQQHSYMDEVEKRWPADMAAKPTDINSPSMRAGTWNGEDPTPTAPSLLDRAESIPLLGRGVSMLRHAPGQVWDALQPGSMRNSFAGPSGISGDPTDLAKYAGAAAATAVTGGGAIPLMAAAGLGGAGAEGIKDTISQVGNPTDTRGPGDILSGMGEAGVETAVAEGLGQGLGSLATKFSPRSPKLSVSLPSRRIGPQSGAPPAFIPAQIRKMVDMESASRDLQELAKPSPLGNISAADRGLKVTVQEQQARTARRIQANKLYAPLDKTSASIRDLVSDDLKALDDIGVEIPKEIRSRLTAARKAQTDLPSVRPDEVATSPDFDLAMSKLDDVSWRSLRELRSAVGAKIGRLESMGSPALGAAKQWYSKLTDAMGASAEASGLRPVWEEADSFYKNNEIQHHRTMEPGKASTGEQVRDLSPSFKFEGGKPRGGQQQEMHSLLSANAPQDIEAMHNMLVPDGDWVAPALQRSGQDAFDQLIEQKVRSLVNAGDSTAKIDMTKMGGAISKMGEDTFNKVVSLSSPQQAARLKAMRNVAAAYSKISAPTGIETAIGLKPTTLMGIPKTILDIKQPVLKWALEHPARTEILLQGITAPGAASTASLMELAKKNIAAVTRLYEMDRGKPPSTPAGLELSQ